MYKNGEKENLGIYQTRSLWDLHKNFPNRNHAKHGTLEKLVQPCFYHLIMNISKQLDKDGSLHYLSKKIID